MSLFSIVIEASSFTIAILPGSTLKEVTILMTNPEENREMRMSMASFSSLLSLIGQHNLMIRIFGQETESNDSDAKTTELKIRKCIKIDSDIYGTRESVTFSDSEEVVDGKEETAQDGSASKEQSQTENPFVERVNRARAKHPNAFKKWSTQEEEKIKDLHGQGYSLSYIAAAIERTCGSVKSRLEKLGIVP